MSGAVLLARGALAHTTPLRPVVQLAIEVLTGALAYLAAVALLARQVSRELLAKLRVALRRHAPA
jgi:hypothetical protein